MSKMNADLVEPGVVIQSIHPNKFNALRESYMSTDDSKVSQDGSSKLAS